MSEIPNAFAGQFDRMPLVFVEVSNLRITNRDWPFIFVRVFLFNRGRPRDRIPLAITNHALDWSVFPVVKRNPSQCTVFDSVELTVACPPPASWPRVSKISRPRPCECPTRRSVASPLVFLEEGHVFQD